MKSGVNANRLCGFLYLFIRLTAFRGEFRIGSLSIPKDVPNALRIVAEHSGEFRQGAVVTLVMHVSDIALTGALYLAFSTYNRTLALLGTLLRVAEGVIMAVAPVWC
ncbi:DUF4386 family protein [Chloroflexota bacterium]